MALRRRSWIMAMGAAAGGARGEGIYRDQRRPSFSLVVPGGWTAERTDEGVTVRRDRSAFTLWVRAGHHDPAEVLAALRARHERLWQGWVERDAGRIPFGGRPALFGVYAGTAPNGVPSLTRLVAMSTGAMSYAATQSLPLADGGRDVPALQLIERSFAIDTAR